MDIQDRSDLLSEELADNLTEYLRALLAASGKYVVVDRGRQAKAMKSLVKKEKKESYKACYDRSCQVPLGKSLAADHILLYSIMRIGTKLVLKAEILDLASEASVEGATSTCPAEPVQGLDDRIMVALDDIATQLGGGPKRAAESGKAPAAETGGTSSGTSDQVPIDVITNVQARLYLDGQPKGRLPKWDLMVSPGEHEFRVEAADHIPQTRKVVITQRTKVKFDLKHRPLTRREWLSSPEWATVKVGGGKGGFHLELEFITLRLPWFYYSAVRVGTSLMGDASCNPENPTIEKPCGDIIEGESMIAVGGAVGLQLGLPPSGRLSIRLGVGAYSTTHAVTIGDDGRSTLAIAPEAQIVYKAARHFAPFIYTQLFFPVNAVGVDPGGGDWDGAAPEWKGFGGIGFRI